MKLSHIGHFLLFTGMIISVAGLYSAQFSSFSKEPRRRIRKLLFPHLRIDYSKDSLGPKFCALGIVVAAMGAILSVV